jgi:asparagine synthase (glutamine-hydrolysing)
MTGIAGFLDWKSYGDEQKETLLSMTRVLSHRLIGADKTLEFGDSKVALTAGSIWSSGDVTVAVEGYLYNHKELRKELSDCGQRFESDGVAELVQNAYLYWGDSFIERLYGAFALVLWDAREQRLILGRDQIGIKPLYYAHREGTVVFGSETKAILQHSLVTREVDARGLSEMLMKGPFISPGQALFRDVHEILPGHIIFFTPSGKRDVSYWDVKSHPHEDSVEDTIEKLREMLERNLGTLHDMGLASSAVLSGGLDSSGLIGMMCKATGNNFQTFSGNTPESLAEVALEELDTPWVRRVAEVLGIENEELLVGTPEIFEHLDASRRALDMPTIAKYETLFYLVLRRVRERQNHSVVIGDAPDELFGSLKWFYDQSTWNESIFPWINPKSAILASGDLLRSIRAEEIQRDMCRDYLRQVPHLDGATPEQARLREIFYLSLKDYLPFVLRHDDRLGMSANLQVSLPFCDPRMAQYVWNIPWEMKNHGGREKGILREVFRSVLPDDVVYRRKSNVPVVFNRNYSDYLHREYERILQDAQSPIYDLIDRNKIRELLDSKIIYEDRFIRWRFDYYLQIEHWMNEYKVVLR